MDGRTDGWTDRQKEAIALPPSPMRSIIKARKRRWRWQLVQSTRQTQKISLRAAVTCLQHQIQVCFTCLTTCTVNIVLLLTILPRDTMLARYTLWPHACLRVCSITSRCSTKMTQCAIALETLDQLNEDARLLSSE